MYLHLGHAAVVPWERVVGVFDLDNATREKDTRATLALLEARGELHTLGRGLPVSLVVTDRGAYLSPLSSAALCKRLAENRWE